MRSLSILGATGSIGRSTLDLVKRAPGSWRVHALTANRDVDSLAESAVAVRAERAVVADDAAYGALKERLWGTGIEAAAGSAAIEEAAEADVVMAAIVGAAGLPSTLRAVRRGATVALANKETLVCAGDLVNREVERSKATLLPVDSEHNAIFQCFDHARPERVARVILTCSGGPFRNADMATMRAATPAQAVKHPVWSMGGKISVDSATLMNKGLELIEAFHLFPISADQLSVVIHPQSIIHSMVEYVDGSVLAQMGTPDMRTPISYALAWPDRMETPCERLDLVKVGRLEFFEPDPERFPALRLAWAALRAGGDRPAVLNAANEIAVAAFLAGRLPFLGIAAVVEDTLDRLPVSRLFSIADVIHVDGAARDYARTAVEAHAI